MGSGLFAKNIKQLILRMPWHGVKGHDICHAKQVSYDSVRFGVFGYNRDNKQQNPR